MLDPKPTLITLAVIAVVILLGWGVVALTAIIPAWTMIGLALLVTILACVFIPLK